MKIAVMVGSLRRGSLNRTLAQNLTRLAGDAAQFEYLDLNLPLYNFDLESDDYPAAAAKLKQQIRSADGVLVATPEYNHSFPGVLKNAIDWSSRPRGDNPWRNKPVVVVGATPGLMGTILAQHELRDILDFLNARVMTSPELYLAEADKMFDESGQVVSKEAEYLTEYTKAFLKFVQENRG